MVYHGRVQKGVVVLINGGDLPEGTEVRVEPVEPSTPPQSAGPSFADELIELTGTIDDLPPDFSFNHDHYIHGQPKR
ncbi:MAG: hypothetical protein C4547_06450 [Phycisphaerales bacterium]|nr:MAG: hypothetical protein C4547_06450 [Phycisphaerales bacterium]